MDVDALDDRRARRRLPGHARYAVMAAEREARRGVEAHQHDFARRPKTGRSGARSATHVGRRPHPSISPTIAGASPRACARSSAGSHLLRAFADNTRASPS